MAWERSGTVTVTNGSAVVTGAGTAWASPAVKAGHAFYGPDGNVYEIAALNTATEITLATSYNGGTAAAQAYAIVPTQSLTVDLHDAVQALVQTANTKIDTLDAWQAAREADLSAAWRSDNDGPGSGLNADLLDGQHASDFRLEDPGNYREVYMGWHSYSATSAGVKRFNFRLSGMGDVSVNNTAFRVDLRGFVYAAGKVCDFTFVGYNYAPSNAVISSQALDRSGHGFACGITRVPSGANEGVWVWVEVDEYHFSTGVYGTRVDPGLAFDPTAGFSVIKTNVGVAVT